MQNRYFVLTGLSFTFWICTAFGQLDNLPLSGPAFYFNSFQDYSEKNSDSALFYLRKLAADSTGTDLFQQLVHDFFAPTFQGIAKQEVNERSGTMNEILNRMLTDSNRLIAEAALPVKLWVDAMQKNKNGREMIMLVNDVMNRITTGDIYTNRIGRYALLIYNEISWNDSMQQLANSLLLTMNKQLKNGQVRIDSGTISRSVLVRRAWFRYLYAFTNHILATKVFAGNKNKSIAHMKIAFKYSPDFIDNSNISGYIYDMPLLTGIDKRTFQDDYINYLTSHVTNKDETLNALVHAALGNPAFKEQLKTFYREYLVGKGNFEEYWVQKVNESANHAPDINLTLSDTNAFSSIENRGKWILIDFWGTWCIPCREEHPVVEKFYKSVLSHWERKIIFITIACNDTAEKVNSYMKKFNYSFPVAMAANEIEKKYRVTGYPFKVLISPQGKYVVIPIGTDWMEFVKNYAGLQ